jgi:Ni/Co efflux regulator RcnB
MNAIFAALAGAILVFGAAQAQSSAQLHGNSPGFPGSPQIGGPNRQESPGIMPNHLAMKPNGEIESVGPNRRAVEDSHFGGPANSDRLRSNFAADRRPDPLPPPPSASPHRWTAGERLPASGYALNVQITRFGLYRLTTPPPNTVWVRSGSDALLVNRTTGEIVRTQYGALK